MATMSMSRPRPLRPVLDQTSRVWRVCCRVQSSAIAANHSLSRSSINALSTTAVFAGSEPKPISESKLVAAPLRQYISRKPSPAPAHPAV